MNNALDEQDTYLPIHFKEMVIDECNTSDVIERSKIDNAIEEIKQEIQNGTIKITSGNEKLFNILENIGE